MQISEHQWKSSGKNIYGNVILPDAEPNKVLIFIHGIGEHIGRYTKWFERFTNLGFAIVTADHHGHGRSAGIHGHFKSYCEPLNFVSMLFEQAEKHFPGLPKVIYGHSMGGNITLNYILRNEPRIKGAIVSSPWIELQKPPSTLLKSMAKIMYHIYPALSIHTGIKRNQLTTNNQELSEIDRDTMLHGKITISTYLELDAAANYIKSNIKKLHIPLLLMQGTSDALVDFKGLVELEKQNPHNIQLKLFDGFFHEIHKEEKNDMVFETIQTFLNQIL